jgi:hypothetical protein
MGTTNQMGIPYPESTDAVANGASAMESLAQMVDTKTGLVEITPTSVAGTGVTISGGSVIMAGTGGSASLNGVFSSKYRFYRVLINFTVSNQVLYFRLRSGGADMFLNNYNYATTYTAYGTGVFGNFNGVALSTNVIGFCDVNTTAQCSLDIVNPFLSLPTNTTGTVSWSGAGGHVSGYHSLFAGYDGFTIFAVSGVMSGEIKVYGYN